MLNIYLTDLNGRLHEQEEITKGSWVSMISPTEEEIRRVTNHLNLPLDFIKDPLDDDERSRIEEEDGNVLIIVDYPSISYDSNQSSVYETIPFGIIITPDCFVTVCLEDNPILHHFLNRKVRGFFTYKKTRFALQILNVISMYYLRYLKQINRKTNEIEKELHQSMKNKELYAFLAIEKSLVYFTTSLKSNKVVLDKILRQKYLRMYEDDEHLLEDTIIEITQAIEMADTYSHILTGMMDTFASIISNNLNIVMKFLTSITIVLSFPTIVASFFGMNVALPLEHTPHAFIIVLCIAFCLSGATAFIFWKKRYF
ncbi:magnesium transporter CorA family protein [Bacillus songklensis]|uniref:Magnesium transporter CorA family protein n=1 Tax=Bacillus songklensis TaxID=1069116 RepID=A0ABV8B4Q0_9BACI